MSDCHSDRGKNSLASGISYIVIYCDLDISSGLSFYTFLKAALFPERIQISANLPCVSTFFIHTLFEWSISSITTIGITNLCLPKENRRPGIVNQGRLCPVRIFFLHWYPRLSIVNFIYCIPMLRKLIYQFFPFCYLKVCI